jgi:hypothetical protein
MAEKVRPSAGTGSVWESHARWQGRDDHRVGSVDCMMSEAEDEAFATALDS